MSDEMPEEDWELHAANFFPRCPLCHSKSLEFDIKYGQKYDYINCHKCHAKWEIDWKGRDYEIESIRLVEVRDVEKIMLKGKKRKPQFWLRMALETKKVPPTEKKITKEIIREKEVIIKIRCQYCSHVYDETLDKCPHCGGRR